MESKKSKSPKSKTEIKMVEPKISKKDSEKGNFVVEQIKHYCNLPPSKRTPSVIVNLSKEIIVNGNITKSQMMEIAKIIYRKDIIKSWKSEETEAWTQMLYYKLPLFEDDLNQAIYHLRSCYWGRKKQIPPLLLNSIGGLLNNIIGSIFQEANTIMIKPTLYDILSFEMENSRIANYRYEIPKEKIPTLTSCLSIIYSEESLPDQIKNNLIDKIERIAFPNTLQFEDIPMIYKFCMIYQKLMQNQKIFIDSLFLFIKNATFKIPSTDEMSEEEFDIIGNQSQYLLEMVFKILPESQNEEILECFAKLLSIYLKNLSKINTINLVKVLHRVLRFEHVPIQLAFTLMNEMILRIKQKEKNEFRISEANTSSKQLIRILLKISHTLQLKIQELQIIEPSLENSDETFNLIRQMKLLRELIYYDVFFMNIYNTKIVREVIKYAFENLDVSLYDFIHQFLVSMGTTLKGESISFFSYFLGVLVEKESIPKEISTYAWNSLLPVIDEQAETMSLVCLLKIMIGMNKSGCLEKSKKVIKVLMDRKIPSKGEDIFIGDILELLISPTLPQTAKNKIYEFIEIRGITSLNTKQILAISIFSRHLADKQIFYQQNPKLWDYIATLVINNSQKVDRSVLSTFQHNFQLVNYSGSIINSFNQLPSSNSSSIKEGGKNIGKGLKYTKTLGKLISSIKF